MATERETRASINDALKKEHANLKKESERLKSERERLEREIDELREQNARLSRTVAQYQREGLELKQQEEEVGEEKVDDDDEREGESAKKKKKKTKQTGASKKSVGVVAIEATKTKKSPLSASAKGNKKTDNDNLADVPAKSPLPSVGPKKRVAPPFISEKKKAKKRETAEAKEDNNEDEDDENGKSNETTLERFQRWSSNVVDAVRASAFRAIGRLLREKKKIEAAI